MVFRAEALEVAFHRLVAAQQNMSLEKPNNILCYLKREWVTADVADLLRLKINTLNAVLKLAFSVESCRACSRITLYIFGGKSTRTRTHYIYIQNFMPSLGACSKFQRSNAARKHMSLPLRLHDLFLFFSFFIVCKLRNLSLASLGWTIAVSWDIS